MWLIVVEDGIAEHGGGGRVADIQAHPHSAVEQLDREMVGVAMVEKHTGTLASLHHQGEVERSRGVEGVQLDVGVGSCKLDGGQVLATLARIAWVALASIGRWRGGKTGAMSARSSLAWRSLLVGRHLKCRKVNQSKEEKKQRFAPPPHWAKTHKTPRNIQAGKRKREVQSSGCCSALRANERGEIISF